jgi:hypothetical protein
MLTLMQGSRTSARRRGAFLLALALAACGLAAADAPPKEWDGLELRKSKKVDRLYVRPEATLAGYKRVRLEPLEVRFAKDWNPNSSRSGSDRLTTADFDKIKKGLATEFAATFAKELAKGGYTIVTESGPDVLDMTPLVVDLYVTAPQKMTAGRSKTYTADPGRMTLVAELRDSETGQILVRALDAQNGSTSGMFQLASTPSNMAAANRIITRWAAALRDALDEAEGKG